MGANLSYPPPPPDSGPGQQRPTSMGHRYASHTFLGSSSSSSSSQAMDDHHHAHSHHRDKKKKASKFATLRKKLTRVRRHSRSLDHTRAIRELTSGWTIRELSGLLEEYEASMVLKELTLQADLTRPHANTLKEDLSLLYDYKYCTDVDLLYGGAVFPVHRAILSVRCPYFRDVLLRHPEYGAQIHVSIRTPGVNVNMFSALLRYLYTGEFVCCEDNSQLRNIALLRKLGEEFGTPNPLEHDLRNLLETGMFSDALLIFTAAASDSGSGDSGSPDGESIPLCSGRRMPKHELRCHKAILAARSPFFRNLLLRRARSGEELTERALHSPTCIVLDESVIPRRYARVLLHAVYLDSVDLSCIVRSSVSMCSLSEVQAMAGGGGSTTKTHATVMDEAMEIYQIGQFLDFPTLSQGCEDLILDNLSLETLVSVLHWSREDHGSSWLHRQALHFLKEEFLQVAHSPNVLHELNHAYMLHAVKSDFLQAGEVDVLSAVLKWGEHQLMKRMEEREPNLLTHTAHSVSKKGVKKRDLNDMELRRDILADLLGHIRTDHIIPANNDILNSAIKRGLVSVPPSHMIGDDSHSTASAWVHGINQGMFFKPRLFMPYYEEVKSLLEERLSDSQDGDMGRGGQLRLLHMSPIPDTLYMVDDKGYAAFCNTPTSPPISVDIIAGTIPVPSDDSLKVMMRREAELQHSQLAQRGYALSCSERAAITHQIQLRVVREMGLPDSTVEVLCRHHVCSPVNRQPVQYPAAQYHHHGGHPQQQHGHYHHHPQGHQAMASPAPAPPPGAAGVPSDPSEDAASAAAAAARYHTPRRVRQRCMYHKAPAPPSVPSSPHAEPMPSTSQHGASGGVSGHGMEHGGGGGGGGTLSDMMPDIAMATASVNSLSLHEPPSPPDLELDLGDGNNHAATGTLYI